jgi:hypothetical protein
MTFRSACFASCLVAFACAGPVLAEDGCGIGCHATVSGACVRDGWQQALPVRNECPATSRPAPPCGPDYRWSRHSMMCVLR